MSRIGRMPIPVPAGVSVIIQGSDVSVKGPKGELSRSFPAEIAIALSEKEIVVSRSSDEPQTRAYHGLVRALLSNMVVGVHTGFVKNLEIVGAGYRARLTDGKLVLQVGFSHLVELPPPAGITWGVDGTSKVRVQGIDKELVGEIAAKVRAVRPPDSYKGKGIRYLGERIRLKPGKKAVGKKK